MTPEEQRIAIAEWLGWKRHNGQVSSGCGCGGWHRDRGDSFTAAEFLKEPPDYCNDLNAVHEADSRLRIDQIARWISALQNVVQPQCTYHPMDLQFWMCHATAAQRCEALCRTLWPERWTK